MRCRYGCPVPEREPDVMFTLPDGRVVAADDVGDPAGVPIVYLHGTPDSRIARHPDDSLATALGVRLVAVDRPGFGHSSVDARTEPTRFADDVVGLLAHLGVQRAGVLAWSAGAPWAVGLAAALGTRCTSLTIAGGTVPFEAFDDPGVSEAAGEPRLAMVDTARELGADTAGELIGPMLVPDPPTAELAREHVEAHDPVTLAELRSVDGAIELITEALLDSCRAGTEGLVHDVRAACSPLGVDLSAVRCPTMLWYGELDRVCPPDFGRWWSERLPAADLRVVQGAGHALLLTNWSEVLRLAATYR